ncbi:MAG: AzlD domain-containing protein [Desulfovibrio sp.]
MDAQTIFITIVGMMLVTYIPRMLPATLLSSRTLPQGLVDWLSFIPAAVLAAMAVPAVIFNQGVPDLSTNNLFFMAAIPTIIAAWFSKGMVIPVVVGMAIVALGRYIGIS